MSQLSRRQFLQFAGITLISGQLPDFGRSEPVSEVYGRALRPTAVYRQADTTSSIIHHLWPDQVLPVTDTRGDWYQTAGGYVERTALQPISPRSPQPAPIGSPFWAEVIGPVAPVWQWCAANAPLVTRIGHGGAAQIIDQLPGWYAVADTQGDMLGWSQASHWTPIRLQFEDAPLEVVVANQQMTVYRSNQTIASAPVSIGQPIPPGTYPLKPGNIGGVHCCVSPESAYHGASWQLRFGNDYELTSVYWHNQFGKAMPGPAIQLSPLIGGWLYRAAGNHSVIRIDHQA